MKKILGFFGILLLVLALVTALALVVFSPTKITVSQAASSWQPAPGRAPETAPQPRQPCDQIAPLRRAFFGDLHVHTSLSSDARSRDMLGTVEDAYRFARGEEIGLGPFDEAGRGTRRISLAVPLDFAAVTDHAERMGEVGMCTTAGSQAFASERCQQFRGERVIESGLLGRAGGRVTPLVSLRERRPTLCGPDNSWCREAIKQAWDYSRAITEQFYDRSSDCSFTTFHGWEHSYAPSMSKVHRNVIFRNELVPELPISALEAPGGPALWAQLDELCPAQTSACEAITIPHNPNASNGRMFSVGYRNQPLEEQRRLAKQRARYDAVVEMMQIKGESECAPGLWQVLGDDDQCHFEKLRGTGEHGPKDCEDEYQGGAMAGFGCQSRLDFVRYALIEGRMEESRIGVNPLRFGLIGSTDTHNATPGATGEDVYEGCCANTDTTPQARLAKGRGFAGKPPTYRNPGGLMGIWARQNTRDDLFDAMQRREVFATSGTRIEPRLFVGTDIPLDACQGDIPAIGYAKGVPMGSSVALPDQHESPVFLAGASADPNSGNLERLQIVKVWNGEADAFHQAVFDIAGNSDPDAKIDTRTCQPQARGSRQLCSTWQDPAFDARQNATYYLRVLETPSCRWHWRQCLTIAEEARPESCSDPNLPKVIQERAWSSPVWVSDTPAG